MTINDFPVRRGGRRNDLERQAGPGAPGVAAAFREAVTDETLMPTEVMLATMHATIRAAEGAGGRG